MKRKVRLRLELAGQNLMRFGHSCCDTICPIEVLVLTMMKKLSFQLLFLIFSFGVLACRMSSNLVQDFEPIPIRTEDAVDLSEKLKQAVQDAEQQGSFTIDISEQQLTSYVALNLAETSEVSITNLQIHLQDGQIWIRGDVHQDNLQLPLTVAVSLSVDTENNLGIEFKQAQIGPFPVPRRLLDTIAQEVEKAFFEQVAGVGEEYIIEEISIGEGSILIRGTKK